MIGKLVIIILVAIILGLLGYVSYDFYINNYSQTHDFRANYSVSEKPSYSSDLQFYPDMRFVATNLSFSIGSECSSVKTENMMWAFNYLENVTGIISFYSSEEGDIKVSCAEGYQQGELFVAGEGGPETIINSTLFNVIVKGKILLLSSDRCSEKVALHELLHVFGFKHSDNPNSIMYNLSSCNQQITEDIIDEIKRLYSIPVLPDLYFSSVSGTKKGSYANLNFSVRNQGLAEASNVSVEFFSDGKKINEESLGRIEPGAGKIFSIKNLRVSSATSISLVISGGNELDKSNNQAELILSS
jgi:hypothetical protein